MKSAQEANFNFLRIWGGGIFQYEAFYAAADDFGILLFHDMMYAQQGHLPKVRQPTFAPVPSTAACSLLLTLMCTRNLPCFAPVEVVGLT